MTGENLNDATTAKRAADLVVEWAKTDRVLRELDSGPGTRPAGQVEAAVLVGMRSGANGCIVKSRLARRIGIHPNSVDRAVRESTATGWVEPDDIPVYDRRLRPIRLTDEGEAVADHILGQLAAAHRLT